MGLRYPSRALTSGRANCTDILQIWVRSPCIGASQPGFRGGGRAGSSSGTALAGLASGKCSLSPSRAPPSRQPPAGPPAFPLSQSPPSSQNGLQKADLIRLLLRPPPPQFPSDSKTPISKPPARPSKLLPPPQRPRLHCASLVHPFWLHGLLDSFNSRPMVFAHVVPSTWNAFPSSPWPW